MSADRSVCMCLMRMCGVATVRSGAADRRSRLRGLAALALSVAALLALSAAVAQAEVPKLISYGTFAASPLPSGVAVDQSSSNVYVTNLLNIETDEPSHVDKFNASGNLLSPSPFGGAYYSGVAVNPTNGDVYVLGEEGGLLTPATPAMIFVYNPNTGALLSSFEVPASRNFSGFLTDVQIAADSAGNVYVPNPPENEVLEYSPSGTLLKTFTGSGSGALKEPTGVAVDSSGNVWVADAGNNRIGELSPTGMSIGEIKSEGVQAVALDGHGNVFATVDNGADFCGSFQPPCTHLVEYDSGGAQVADIGAGLIGSNEAAFPSMVAVNESSGRVYVTDGIKKQVFIFGPPTAPTVQRELTAEVGASEAKLGAYVNPGGLETSYRFEYLTVAAFQANGESFSGPNHSISVPFPEGNVGQGIVSRTVWASASGLEPGTTYDYRIVVKNALGEAGGAEQTFTAETAAQGSCPNEQLRNGFSANLPDCRAYELVSTPNPLSAQPDGAKTSEYADGGGIWGNLASSDGDRMSFLAVEVLPGASSGGVEYLATRGESGWSSESVLPLQSYMGDRCTLFHTDSAVSAYSADLSKTVLYVDGANTGCGSEAVEVVKGEPLGVENLLMREGSGSTYQLINVPPPGVTPSSARFAAATANLSHVVFTESARLTADAPPGVPDLFEWSTNGASSLVTVLPDGTAAAGALAAAWEQHPHVISADGSRVFFTANGNLYVRIDGERTVQIDEAQDVSGPGGGGRFIEASADGTRVFFTDEANLTADSTAALGESDLYECELPEGASACKLSDLTVGKAGEHADITGSPGISADGSYAYFVAQGALTGAQQNGEGETAQAGKPNLYLYHAGTLTFIKTVNRNDAESDVVARVSPNGLFLAFRSTKSLTGYDNTDARTGEADPEIFLYDAASNSLACASCNPSGEPPVMGPGPKTLEGIGEETGGATIESNHDGAPHFLSDGGQVFFQTREALLPQDTDGLLDVYEYEDGRLHLISAGTGSTRSFLLDATEDGGSVFFLTVQELVPQDTNAESLAIYDARVDGGFPEVASPPPCTTADACRTPVSPQPSIYGAPASQTFSGAGNLAPPAEVKPKTKPKSKPLKCKKGAVKKRGKCVKKSKKRAKKAAHANRTGK